MTDKIWRRIPSELVAWCWGTVGTEVSCPCGVTIIVEGDHAPAKRYKCHCGREYVCRVTIDMACMAHPDPDLQAELDAWERASGEALVHFEVTLDDNTFDTPSAVGDMNA